MEVSGAWPSPTCPWPNLPHGGLQVLKDDHTVVTEHVRDTAGMEPCLAWCKPQQSQQERPECRLERHLEGTLGQGGVPRLARDLPYSHPSGSLLWTAPYHSHQGLSELYPVPFIA